MAPDDELVELRDFLVQHEPFDAMDPAVVATLPRRLGLRYYRRGSAIMTVGRDSDQMWVVRSGAVEIRDHTGALQERAGEGGTFGTTTLLGGNPSTHDVTALEDSLLVVFPAEVFHELARTDPAFQCFFLRQSVRRLQGTGGGIAADAQRGAGTGGTDAALLRTTVREMVRRDPVTIAPHASLRAGAQVMAEHGTSSLLVLEDERLVGILTDRDLRRVLAEGRDPADPVSSMMTRDPITVPADARAIELLLHMLGHTIHHLPVLDTDGSVLGLVSSTDVMRLESGNPLYLVNDIARQQTLEGLEALGRKRPEVVARLVEQGLPAAAVGHVLTAIADAFTRALVAQAVAALEQTRGPAPRGWCWVVLGSAARGELGPSSDQDHALILADDADDAAGGGAGGVDGGVDGGRAGGGDSEDEWFAELAERVTAGLERCGYPRCPGDVMATNPRWRQPLSAWRREFLTWLEAPTAEAILHAGIFFDLRPVAGDPGLATRLSEDVLARAPQAHRFLALLTKAAVLNEPPLGFFRTFVVAKEGEHKDQLDLKRGGLHVIVEAARVWALSRGIAAVCTLDRIEAAHAGGLLGDERATELVEAFNDISGLRLRQQVRQAAAGVPRTNFVAPDALSSADKRRLREAFQVIRATQSALAQTHPLSLV
ncbi:putative nucleotidyltransferase substrate binding domain-containing protein [Arsenicicoccus piscis]|uniref:Cyclic nucleotide-binding protein n=1 Tax=Arsenicicoccus piscis TaxID=673954 RepID=A0ABQ6HTL3_9MICO|nr:putative nucleotidyltransferase substrate binding domain-containing protein [Arsenicicoccus piscis]GMA21819.1 cyclic nucleotide-binding protein [Arsenicicoccus piscis]